MVIPGMHRASPAVCGPSGPFHGDGGSSCGLPFGHFSGVSSLLLVPFPRFSSSSRVFLHLGVFESSAVPPAVCHCWLVSDVAAAALGPFSSLFYMEISSQGSQLVGGQGKGLQAAWEEKHLPGFSCIRGPFTGQVMLQFWLEVWDVQGEGRSC